MTLKPFKFSRIQEAWEYRTEPEAERMLAAVFWRTILAVAVAGLLLALWFGIQELNAASQAESVTPTPGATQSPWTPAQLRSTLDSFAEKQNTYQALSQSFLPAVADPSK